MQEASTGASGKDGSCYVVVLGWEKSMCLAALAAIGVVFASPGRRAGIISTLIICLGGIAKTTYFFVRLGKRKGVVVS